VTLLTTDLLVERVHFFRGRISAFNLGYKSLAINLSDIAAMGGTAREAFVSIAIPQNCELDYLEDIYSGMKALAAKYEVNILGGDTTSSKQDLIINVVVHGLVAEKEVLYRDTARPGDRICSTGRLGDSKAGLHLILNQVPLQSPEFQYLYKAHVLPEPQLREGRFFAVRDAVKAAIDVSDGLSSDLGHIVEESKVGARLFADKIPLSDQLLQFCDQFDFDALQFALSGGEDYTLLCTIDPEAMPRIAAEFEKEFQRPLFQIGEITETPTVVMFHPDGNQQEIAASGWDHFKTEKKS
jgi:thiamine-monophosphate kinase